jgi:hypothetical protein
MRRLFPRFSSALALTLLMVASLLPLSIGIRERSRLPDDHGLRLWLYTPNACKYDQARYSVSGDCGSGSGCTISTVYWRGGTASGSCDPSNDIDSWHLQFVKIIKVSDGSVSWSYGPGNTHRNCNVERHDVLPVPKPQCEQRSEDRLQVVLHVFQLESQLLLIRATSM